MSSWRAAATSSASIFVIPEYSTSASSTCELKATVARIAIFAAASAPETSSVGIGLRVAALLRVGERLVVALAALHLGEHEVGRAVDDAEHAVDVRDDERLAQHLDHRDRGADARLEPQLDAGLRRGREELRAAPRDELLVRGDDALAALQQLEDVAARRLDAAHHLGHDGDARIVEDLGEVRGEHPTRQVGNHAPSRGRARAPSRRGADGPVARSMSSADSVRRRLTAAPTVP